MVKTYTDEAKSATTDNRSGFQQMISDSALNLFDVVLVHKLDRFARNRYDSAFYKRKLKLNKVNVESILVQLDNSPESIILESVLEGMAEYYSKNTYSSLLRWKRASKWFRSSLILFMFYTKRMVKLTLN